MDNQFYRARSRYWIEATAGLKNAQLFEDADAIALRFPQRALHQAGVKRAWEWAQPSQWIRWFTDGEKRDGNELWKIASGYLSRSETPTTYPYPKVWREGLEVAMKIKGSQGKPRRVWVKQEHPWTTTSSTSDVHANHVESFNSALRRRATACLVALFTSGNPTSARRYRRRQNHYAKVVAGLQRALNVQRLLHNWVRPHWGLGKKTTPAMAMGFIARPVTISELLSSRSFEDFTP